jgi:hypothetical protein
MIQVIHKYVIDPFSESPHIIVPEGATFLSMQVQKYTRQTGLGRMTGEEVVAWFQHAPRQPGPIKNGSKCSFQFIPTGLQWNMPSEPSDAEFLNLFEYVTTLQLDGGQHVLHAFRTDSAPTPQQQQQQ